ncbi:MAG: glycosyltransferase family 4 protein [Parcubacteria group bacterium]|jgi:glycosyltransferase involved in cell wall biosynthesis
MKVLFFNYEYPPLGGGAAYASQNILREYAKLTDVEVDFVTSSLDNQYHLEKMGENIRVHRLPIGKNKNNLTYQSQKDLLVYAWKSYFFSKKLISEANKNKKPYNLTHSFFSVPCGFVSMILKKKYRLPYIVSLRGSDVPGYSERFSFIYCFLKPLIIRIWKKAGAVVANSSMLRDLALKSNNQQKVDVIYNGINIEHFRPGAISRENKNFTILCASRLSRRKGFDYVIDAFNKIHEKYPEARLVIAGGEGNAEEELKNQTKELKLENKITFTGFVTPNTQFLKYYNAADVFVLPSLNEGMSNNMLEAMASGLPIIMTPTGGAEELIKDGVNGCIVRFKDSADIAEKLEKLINNPELCKKMGIESRKIAEKMSWKSVAEKYYELYKNIA